MPLFESRELTVRIPVVLKLPACYEGLCIVSLVAWAVYPFGILATSSQRSEKLVACVCRSHAQVDVAPLQRCDLSVLSLLHPRIMRRICIHSWAPDVRGFGMEFIVPGLVEVGLAQAVLPAVLGQPIRRLGTADVNGVP